MRTALFIAAGLALAGHITTALAQDDFAVTLGQRIVTDNCSRCHAVGAADESPLAVAPPFRDLYLRYDVEALEEALVEGIITGHPAMPVFVFNPEQAAAIIAYLKTLEPRRAAR